MSNYFRQFHQFWIEKNIIFALAILYAWAYAFLGVAEYFHFAYHIWTYDKNGNAIPIYEDDITTKLVLRFILLFITTTIFLIMPWIKNAKRRTESTDCSSHS